MDSDSKVKSYSLGIGHCGVLGEGEVVSDVLVVREPAVSPYQPSSTHSHLWEGRGVRLGEE